MIKTKLKLTIIDVKSSVGNLETQNWLFMISTKMMSPFNFECSVMHWWKFQLDITTTTLEIQKLIENLTSMKLDGYSFELCQERMDKW